MESNIIFQDMTARDLLQQRMTMLSGDTAWRFSPLVIAALEGSLAVLDGIHRVNAGTFAVLHRLLTTTSKSYSYSLPCLEETKILTS